MTYIKKHPEGWEDLVWFAMQLMCGDEWAVDAVTVPLCVTVPGEEVPGVPERRINECVV